MRIREEPYEMWNVNRTSGTCLIVILWMTGFAQSGEPVDYVRDVKPILSSRCYACHGALKQESELRLDAGRMILKGGDSGPAIVAGKSAESLLVERITGDDDSRMPPEGELLTPMQIDLIKAWIDAGAESPAAEPLQANPREHWSFKTPVRPPVPDVKNRDWVRNPIDAFVAAEHDQRGLASRPSAKPAVLLRRVYLDLIGLPPTPEELRAFVSDSSTNAYETVVDRLLGFSVWMAGGGIKGGIAHGATDEIGFHAVENRHYVTDIHATVLHQLGLDPRRLEVPGHKRLEIDFGKPIQEIIA